MSETEDLKKEIEELKEELKYSSKVPLKKNGRVDKRTRHTGAPPSFAKLSHLKKIIRKLKDYCEATDIPILEEFCYLNKITPKRFYDNQILWLSKEKYLMTKRKANLERAGLYSNLEKNKTAGFNTDFIRIFLNQMGVAEKKKIEIVNKIEDDQEFDNLSPKERTAYILSEIN